MSRTRVSGSSLAAAEPRRGRQAAERGADRRVSRCPKLRRSVRGLDPRRGAARRGERAAAAGHHGADLLAARATAAGSRDGR